MRLFVMGSNFTRDIKRNKRDKKTEKEVGRQQAGRTEVWRICQSSSR